MATNSEGDEFSLSAFVLVILAALLILIEALVLLAVGSVVSVVSSPAGLAVSALGVVGILLGVALGGMAYVLYRYPGSSRVAGVAAMLLAFVSQFTGGGFLLGLLLGIIGGIVAIFFEADTDTAVDLGDL